MFSGEVFEDAVVEGDVMMDIDIVEELTTELTTDDGTISMQIARCDSPCPLCDSDVMMMFMKCEVGSCSCGAVRFERGVLLSDDEVVQRKVLGDC